MTYKKWTLLIHTTFDFQINYLFENQKYSTIAWIFIKNEQSNILLNY